MENNNHWLASLIVFILLICGCNAMNRFGHPDHDDESSVSAVDLTVYNRCFGGNMGKMTPPGDGEEPSENSHSAKGTYELTVESVASAEARLPSAEDSQSRIEPTALILEPQRPSLQNTCSNSTNSCRSYSSRSASSIRSYSSRSASSIHSYSSRSASSSRRRKVSRCIVDAGRKWMKDQRKKRSVRWIEFVVKLGTAILQIFEFFRFGLWLTGLGNEEIRYDRVLGESSEQFKPYLIGIFVLNVLKMRNAGFVAAYGGNFLRSEAVKSWGSFQKYLGKPLQFIIHPNCIFEQSTIVAVMQWIISIPFAFLGPLAKLCLVDWKKPMDVTITSDLEWLSSFMDFTNALDLYPVEIVLRFCLFSLVSGDNYNPGDPAKILIYWLTLLSILSTSVHGGLAVFSYPPPESDPSSNDEK